MLLFRSLTVGLLGACVYLLVASRHGSTPQPPAPAVTVVDVAPGVGTDEIADLLHLAPDEHVVSVGDRPVTSDLAAGAAMREQRSDFLDLGVAGPAGERRVLVLRH